MRDLQKIGFADKPDDPFHGPPIHSGLPATINDTRENQLFHAPLPKGHENSGEKFQRLLCRDFKKTLAKT
jgi:hypothetical protein